MFKWTQKRKNRSEVLFEHILKFSSKMTKNINRLKKLFKCQVAFEEATAITIPQHI